MRAGIAWFILAGSPPWDLTRTAVLALLGRTGPASRADIARELEVSPATVTQVTRRLLDQGMLEVLDYAESRGGRPGQLLGLVGDAGRAVGVKVMADHLVVVDVRLDGTVLDAQTMPFDPMAPDAIGWLAALLRQVASAQGESPLLGVGIGVPGMRGRHRQRGHAAGGRSRDRARAGAGRSGVDPAVVHRAERDCHDEDRA